MLRSMSEPQTDGTARGLRGSLPEDADGAAALDVAVPGEERQVEGPRCGADERIERVAVDLSAEIVRVEHLAGGQIVRLVRGIAEQVGEEVARRAPEVEAAGPGEERDLPDDGRGDVDKRFAP